jgi:hypothetical protein
VYGDIVPRAKVALAQVGYVPNLLLSSTETQAYLVSGSEYPFQGAGCRNLLELQWNIVPRFYAVNFDIEQLFQRASTASIPGRTVLSLDSGDLLLR